jgi:hypothetical protein
VPAQPGVWAHQQPGLAEHLAGKAVEQSRQEGPVGGSEPDLATLAVQLPFEDRDLVAQRQDFDFLIPIANRQQPKYRQPVCHSQVHQSKQHNKASSPIGHLDTDSRAARSVHAL